jgi:hypothetical protein
VTRLRLLAALLILVAGLSGIAGGIGAAALALALASKALTTLTVEQAETLLVVAPLVGLLPASCVLLLARSNRWLARLLPAAGVVWALGGVASFAWLALNPSLR